MTTHNRHDETRDANERSLAEWLIEHGWEPVGEGEWQKPGECWTLPSGKKSAVLGASMAYITECREKADASHAALTDASHAALTGAFSDAIADARRALYAAIAAALAESRAAGRAEMAREMGGPEAFVCPDCGPVAADEDGCCASCGADCEIEARP